VVHNGSQDRPSHAVVPYAKFPTTNLAFAVRTAGDPNGLAPLAAGRSRGRSPQPAFDVMSMRKLLAERTIGLQYASSIMGVFAALALVLAGVGSTA
jgi:hypothetical protein